MKKIVPSMFLTLVLLPLVSLAEDKAASEDPVMATVNGVPITRSEVMHFVSKQPRQLTPEVALRELINVELVNQAARKENLLQDPTLQLEIKRNTSALIASTYLKQHLDKLEITDEQLAARYQSDYVAGNTALEYNANHILVKTQEEAREIITQLENGGDFQELAKTLSTGPSGKKGGALGWFKKDDMVAPFSLATQTLQPGNYSKEPVQTQFGWHVILLNETRKSDPPSLDTVSQQLANSIAADSLKARLEDLHNSSTIEFRQQ